MTWRVHVTSNLNGLSITMGEKFDSNPLVVVRPLTLEYEIPTNAEYFPPSLVIPEELGRALLEALHNHYSGVSDVRTLREDYLNERKRVDKLIEFLVSTS